MPGFGSWKHTCDRAATVLAYSRAEAGGADTCDCAYCRNFRLARARAFPAEFQALLDALGIDPAKDGEAYYNGPLGGGRHCYAGWYHFIGTLDEPGGMSAAVDLGNGFRVWMCRAASPRLEALKGLPAVQVEFYAEAVPWLLDEAEPK